MRTVDEGAALVTLPPPIRPAHRAERAKIRDTDVAVWQDQFRNKAATNQQARQGGGQGSWTARQRCRRAAGQPGSGGSQAARQPPQRQRKGPNLQHRHFAHPTLQNLTGPLCEEGACCTGACRTIVLEVGLMRLLMNPLKSSDLWAWV